MHDDEVAHLPPVVQRYLRFMGVVGLPRVVSLRGRFVGRFRLRPGQSWMPCEAVQLSTADPLARLFRMRVDLAGVVPMVGLDRYAAGRGSMDGRLLGLVRVASGSGGEFDLGELTTFLNDAVLLAPSMLLGSPVVRWTEVDDRTFTVSLSDGSLTSTGTVTVDAEGAPTAFTTEDRYASLPEGLVRARWSTPVDGWTQIGGRSVPTRARATWDLPAGPFTYVEGVLVPASLEWNVESHGGDEAVAPRSRDASVLRSLEGALRIVGAVATAPVSRRWTNAWGATPSEVGAELPGDEWVPEPKMSSTRAITIAAPPDRVWRWLVQIGHGRGGLYSYEGLEELARCDLHNAEELLPDGVPSVGDLVRLGPEGYPAFRVAQLEEGASFVLVALDPRSGSAPDRATDATATTISTWQWQLRPLDGGSATRLIARQRYTYPTRSTVLWHVVEPISFVMERRMLLGIRERAERPA